MPIIVQRRSRNQTGSWFHTSGSSLPIFRKSSKILSAMTSLPFFRHILANLISTFTSSLGDETSARTLSMLLQTSTVRWLPNSLSIESNIKFVELGVSNKCTAEEINTVYLFIHIFLIALRRSGLSVDCLYTIISSNSDSVCTRTAILCCDNVIQVSKQIYHAFRFILRIIRITYE